MTPEELRAIRERCEAATPGPWFVVRHDYGGWSVCTEPNRWDGVEVFDDGSAGDEYSRVCSDVDRDFITAARTDVPALLDEVERLTRERDAYAQSHRILKGVHGALADGGCVVPPLDSFEVEETIRELCRARDEARAIANAAVRELNAANARAAMADQLSGKPGGFEL